MPIAYRTNVMCLLLIFLLKATYFKRADCELGRKISQSLEEDEEEKDDVQFVKMTRLILGGLFLPTVAVGIDRFILSHLGLFSKSTLMRTFIVSSRTI